MNDPFAKCHPVVNFLFFAGAICLGVVIQHPAYLLVGILAGAAYYLLLHGKKGIRMLLGMLPLFLFLTVVNPLFNLYGATPLFYPFGRPYTAEALLYGAAIAGIFVSTMIWFGCYNNVLTSDKFTSLFGNLIPSISLLLVMVLRMVPNLIRKAGQITGARRSIGKGLADTASFREKIQDGTTVLGALTAWALEGSVVTGDSMRARGYGSARRSSFMIYRFTTSDFALLIGMVVLLLSIITAACMGQVDATFTPVLFIAPPSWGVIAYTLYLSIPTVYHIKEALQWRISRSKI